MSHKPTSVGIMSMEEYIKETEFAASELIKLIFYEEKEIKKLTALLTYNQNLYNQFLAMEYDLEGVSPAQLQHAYIQAVRGPQQQHINREIMRLKNSLRTKENSIKALCGALLQISKQGISIVHGNLESCPDYPPNSKKDVSEPLKDFIWWGRNQSLHYEEGKFKYGVTNFFNNLCQKYGEEFSLEKNDNLAKEIISILEWTSYESI
ncbi:hypothetical protein M4D55_04510 [Metabacillus idriensis]|uniref:hypothetical protein n=1 Tax=Metabacillus idriensis TaxID=324768 RepID=UPI00203E9118|nr:hypothetical protein [Metabacillus idriensis]MCM3595045.1 hypothetical protein [Metabacillus idriensis]